MLTTIGLTLSCMHLYASENTTMCTVMKKHTFNNMPGVIPHFWEVLAHAFITRSASSQQCYTVIHKAAPHVSPGGLFQQQHQVGLEYLFSIRVATTRDLNAMLFPPSSENTMRCIAV